MKKHLHVLTLQEEHAAAASAAKALFLAHILEQLNNNEIVEAIEIYAADLKKNQRKQLSVTLQSILPLK